MVPPVYSREYILTPQVARRLPEAHGASDITALALVSTLPRVLSGAHDGTVKMWNFSSGECLKQFLSPDAAEVLPVV